MTSTSPTLSLLLQLEPNWKKITWNKKIRKVRLQGEKTGTFAGNDQKVLKEIKWENLLYPYLHILNNGDYYPYFFNDGFLMGERDAITHWMRNSFQVSSGLSVATFKGRTGKLVIQEAFDSMHNLLSLFSI